jgi:signal transduction histidine kinase
MSAKLAHEIRNPLSSITLNIDLVGDEIQALTDDDPARGDEARGLLQSIKSEVRRIHRVTEDYLKFARLPKLYREQLELNEILKQGLSFLESLFEASNVTVQTEFAPDLPPILADEGQLWQAILNLVRNAIEAMPDGGRLVLRTCREHDEVVLHISDSGSGVDHDHHDQLFKPFFSTKTGGTGLGLPLTQQIVAEHGGVIECPQTPDQGTTFVIRLPIQREETDG